MQPPILIISPPRSGSSLVGFMLNQVGVWGGEMKIGDSEYPVKYNPYGYFENIAINKILIDYLRTNDTMNMGKRFQPLNLDADYEEFDKKVIASLSGKNEKQPWFYKNVKSVFCWRLWDKYFPEATWVIVKRNRDDILKSIKRTSFMDAYNTDEEWRLYLDKLDSIVNTIQVKCRFFVIDIDKIFRGDLWEFKLIISLIGLTYSDKMLGCIDKNCWSGNYVK